MVDLRTYVLILLAIAAVGMFYIFRVIREQVRLFKNKLEDREIRHFRRVLFAISLVIVIMGLIPITINLYSLVAPTNRPHQVSMISLVYSLGVHLQSLLLSWLLWQIYKIAGKDID